MILWLVRQSHLQIRIDQEFLNFDASQITEHLLWVSKNVIGVNSLFLIIKKSDECFLLNRDRYYVIETFVGLVLIIQIRHDNQALSANKVWMAVRSSISNALLYKVTSKSTGKNFVTNVYWNYL